MDINKFLKQNKRVTKFGAPMGHSGWNNPDCPHDNMRCQRMKMQDGCYSYDGTYWGAGNPKIGYMYAIFNGKNAEYEAAKGILFFVRAKTRAQAIASFKFDQRNAGDFVFVRDNR